LASLPTNWSSTKLRTYQAHLLRERKLTPGTVVNQVAALRFFFVKTLKRQVCGVEVSKVTVRLELRTGRCAVRHEIVFEDPILGLLPLDDTLTIEIWRFKGQLAR
jgi:hypothetical protein